jgi:hypothetical protein
VGASRAGSFRARLRHCQFRDTPFVSYLAGVGPLAHPEEQGTFNPKVPGSRPGRPTVNCKTGTPKRMSSAIVWKLPGAPVPGYAKEGTPMTCSACPRIAVLRPTVSLHRASEQVCTFSEVVDQLQRGHHLELGGGVSQDQRWPIE